MQFLAWVITAVNLYVGTRFFLNAIHVLHTSKYSQTRTVVYTLLFIGMSAVGIYLLLVKEEINYALLLGIGPWITGLVLLIFSMLAGDYK